MLHTSSLHALNSLTNIADRVSQELLSDVVSGGVPKTSAAFTSALRPIGAKRATLLTVLASHELVDCDLQLAYDRSDLLRESITQGSSKTYQCDFELLSEISRKRNLFPLSVDAITLCSWMLHITHGKRLRLESHRQPTGAAYYQKP